MAPISSANWNNSSNAGVWYVNLNNNRTNSNNNIGFRSDSDSPRIRQRNGGAKGDTFRRVVAAGSAATAKSARFHDFSRCHVALEGFVS
jgi:hypothetical protein